MKFKKKFASFLHLSSTASTTTTSTSTSSSTASTTSSSTSSTTSSSTASTASSSTTTTSSTTAIANATITTATTASTRTIFLDKQQVQAQLKEWFNSKVSKNKYDMALLCSTDNKLSLLVERLIAIDHLLILIEDGIQDTIDEEESWVAFKTIVNASIAKFNDAGIRDCQKPIIDALSEELITVPQQNFSELKGLTGASFGASIGLTFAFNVDVIGIGALTILKATIARRKGLLAVLKVQLCNLHNSIEDSLLDHVKKPVQKFYKTSFDKYKKDPSIVKKELLDSIEIYRINTKADFDAISECHFYTDFAKMMK